jgi:hypothetical protein
MTHLGLGCSPSRARLGHQTWQSRPKHPKVSGHSLLNLNLTASPSPEFRSKWAREALTRGT